MTRTRIFWAVVPLLFAMIIVLDAVSAFSPQASFVTPEKTYNSRAHRSRPAITPVKAHVSMSTVLDRPTTVVNPGTATPAVQERATVEKSKSPAKEKKRTGSEAWEVRIFNDGKNTREFVARCLVQIVGQSEITAYQTMMQAHQNGVAVVGRYVYEVAEMYYGELKKNGIICDIVPVDDEK